MAKKIHRTANFVQVRGPVKHFDTSSVFTESPTPDSKSGGADEPEIRILVLTVELVAVRRLQVVEGRRHLQNSGICCTKT